MRVSHTDNDIIYKEEVVADIIDCQKKSIGEHETFVYLIELRNGRSTWKIERCYTDFERLYNWMVHLFPKERIPELPPKVNLFKTDREIVQERKTKFTDYLNNLLSNINISSTYEFNDFLEIGKHIKQHPSQNSRGQLYVCICKARNVPKAAHLYIEIGFVRSLIHNTDDWDTIKSDSCTSSLPYWNEEYLFPVNNRTKPLRIAVWNGSILKQESFGFIDIDVNTLPEDEMVEDWFALLDGYSDAEISLQLKFTTKSLSSNLKSPTKLNPFRIELDTPPVYYIGEKVTGNVTLYKGRPISSKIKVIDIIFEGYQQTNWWSEVSPQTNQTNGSTNLPSQHGCKIALIEKSFVLFSFDMDYWKQLAESNSGTIPPGQYRFPFSIDLPDASLPPSFNGEYGHTNYKLRAFMRHKKVKERTTMSPITILTNYPISNLPVSESPLEVNFSQYFSKDTDRTSSIRLNIILSSLRFYIGMKNPFKVIIDNGTDDFTINGLSVTLNANKYIFFEDKMKNPDLPGRKASVKSIELNVTEGFPIEPGKKKEIIVELIIPQDTLPTMRSLESPLIILEYDITIQCHLSDEERWTSSGENKIRLKHHVIICHPPRQLVEKTIQRKDGDRSFFHYSEDLNSTIELTSTKKTFKISPKVKKRLTSSKERETEIVSTQEISPVSSSHVIAKFLKQWNIETQLIDNYMDQQ